MKALSALAVTAVVRRDAEVLLVRQRDGAWDLPGGMVETGEFADEAVVRELREETGLGAEPPFRLLSVVQLRNPGAPPPGLLTALYFEVTQHHGELRCEDPDGDVLEAEWVPVAEAVARLSANGAAHVREPALDCLTRPGAELTFQKWPGNSCLIMVKWCH
ncbi:NUDIX hydrolase [Nonomuraea bangladeshensis]|uniref:NUDIX hydrolase n=1 Tax=Nonomuraea bangladeshensis TaxID=404385 RepID=UPI003C2CD26C